LKEEKEAFSRWGMTKKNEDREVKPTEFYN
jgi:hypothetical protein